MVSKAELKYLPVTTFAVMAVVYLIYGYMFGFVISIISCIIWIVIGKFKLYQKGTNIRGLINDFRRD